MQEVSQIALEHGFELVSEEHLPEIEGTAYVMRHLASKARLLYMRNDDVNKAFSISFKTPAADDTGVFHILEHSVLCGSEKFPVKEPFVNLLKSSMQTFLNAMTFPDKTMYPVASTNERDLLNLMDVYLDAVFKPAIYRKPAIFEQEGWHLEVEEGEGGARELAFNGVVFNEMKGALSDPESVLYDRLSAALFPHTTYRFESGGTPEAIPTLTYEAFLDSHRRHYRADNSYITLYGDLDLGLFLSFLDREYLTPLAAQTLGHAPSAGCGAECGVPAGTPNPLEVQEPVCALGIAHPMATAPENASCAVGFVIGHARERERVIATDILLDAIMGSNEAPMKRALLDAGLASDASAFLADAVAQPFAVVQLRGVKPGCAPRLREVVLEQARRLAEGGLDRQLVEAALSHAEFIMRERNFGYADGVVLSMSAMAGWLYGEDMACAYLRYEDAFASLRQRLGEGYFEQLLRELFLENPHQAEVEIVPVEEDEDDVLDARLAQLAEGMDEAAFDEVEAKVLALRAAQEEPDSPEALATLPQLSPSDLGDAATEAPYYLDESRPRPILRHDLPTRGIAYAYRYFDLACLDFDELPYASILALVLGKLDTAQHTAAEIDTLVQGRLGNLSFFTEVHEKRDDREAVLPVLAVSSSALEENAAFAAQLACEVMRETSFADSGKILDILTQKKVAMEQACANAGHSAAMARVSSYYRPAAVAREQLGGMDFYRFLKDLLARYESCAAQLAEKLAEIARRVFTDEGSLTSFAGSDEALCAYEAALASLPASEQNTGKRLAVPAPQVKNEAFVVPSDVTYSAVGYDRELLGSAYEGSWLVAARALSYDYLWNEVRVKGGAYGCGFQNVRTGNMRFYSYRDPRIDETLARFEQAGAWLEAFNPSEAEMDGYVVSTVAGIDAPVKARELLRRQDADFVAGFTPADRLAIRRQVIEASPASVRALAPFVTQAAAQGMRCVFGNAEIIDTSKVSFARVDLLND